MGDWKIRKYCKPCLPHRNLFVRTAIKIKTHRGGALQLLLLCLPLPDEIDEVDLHLKLLLLLLDSVPLRASVRIVLLDRLLVLLQLGLQRRLLLVELLDRMVQKMPDEMVVLDQVVSHLLEV